MSTPTALARQRYATESVSTASPARLLLMLYDRLVRDLVMAEAAVREGDIAVANDQLVHAQAILLELNASLDHDVWDGAGSMSQLYLFCWSELVAANVQKDASRVATVRGLIEPLREAWREAALSCLAAAATG